VDPLLAAKVRPPSVPGFAVDRVRLLRRLDLRGAGHLSLVVAPAGFGKSVLLAQWAAEQPAGSVAWLTIDERDDDPARLAACLRAALEAVGAPPADLPEATGPGLGDRVLADLLATLATLPDVAIVLDNVDALGNAALYADLGVLAEQCPPNIHLLLGCRTDLRLPLHALRLRREVTEVRQADLVFSTPEAASLVTSISGQPLSGGQVEALVNRTEGWPAGLQMAAISLAGADDLAEVVDHFVAYDEHVVGYLSDEVLAKLAPELRTFLLETSVLERLSAPLCDAVTGRDDGAEMLEWLHGHAVFVAPLRGPERSFRYHRLFRSVLRHRLAVERPGEARLLAERAARWSLEQGDDEAAGEYLSAAEDWAGLLQLVSDRMQRNFEQGNLYAELGWLERVPEWVVRQQPGMLLDLAVLATLVGKTLLAQKYLADFESAGDVAPGDHAIALTLRASWVENHLAADAGLVAVTAADEALERLSPSDLPASGPSSIESLRALLALIRARALFYRGDLGPAAEVLDRALDRGIEYAPWAVNCHATRALVAAWDGELRVAEQHAARTFAVARDAELLRHPGALHAHLALAWVLLCRGDVDGAAGRTALAESFSVRYGRPSALGLTVVQRALLDLVDDDAHAGLERVHAYRNEGHPGPPPLLEARLLATEARMLMELGSVEHAGELLAHHRGLQSPAIRSVSIAVALVDGDLGNARKLHDEWEQAYPQVSVELLVWRAALEDLDGDRDAAITALAEAVRRAEPEGDLRAVTQALPHVAGPLLALARTDPNPFLVRLAALADASGGGHVPFGNDLLVDPLTDRELEVLSLLPTYLPKADMAKELIVSLNTLKSHVSHIYLKLGVANRREAVEAAQRLGLLPAPADADQVDLRTPSRAPRRKHTPSPSPASPPAD
jgi:LuxR family maltose regulon positive regulatory protein